MHRQILTCALLVGAVQGWHHGNPMGTSTSVSDCRATDLHASAMWRHISTTLRGTVTITNRSSAGCTLYSGADAPVMISLSDARGHPLPVYPPKLDRLHTIAPYGLVWGLVGHASNKPGMLWRPTERDRAPANAALIAG